MRLEDGETVQLGKAIKKGYSYSMSRSVTLNITEHETYSEPLLSRGLVKFSLIARSFVGLVVVQRRKLKTDEWEDITFYKTTYRGIYTGFESYEYRFGIKFGDYRVGVITGNLTNE
mgnify:CR=1 FL=1